MSFEGDGTCVFGMATVLASELWELRHSDERRDEYISNNITKSNLKRCQLAFEESPGDL